MIGQITFDLEPTPENNRNSEGAFIALTDGKILFVYSRYSCNGWRDDAEADLYGIISEDNGSHFGEPFPILLHAQMHADNIMSVSLLRMQNGDIGMFFVAKQGAVQCLPYLVRSQDEGRSWSTPIPCGCSFGYYVVCNDRVIRCSNGRLLIPASLHKTETIVDRNGITAVRYLPGILTLLASDDDGHSWATVSSNTTLPVSQGCTTGVQEPGLLQLRDNTLWCYIRNDSGRQYEVFSKDNGASWSIPMPSAFTSAESPFSAKRLRDGRILAVWNPIPAYNGRPTVFNGLHTFGRTPLVMAVSTDNEKTFSAPVPIEEDPAGGFCYTAIHETKDGFILLAYSFGTKGDECILNRLRIRKIPLSALNSGTKQEI